MTTPALERENTENRGEGICLNCYCPSAASLQLREAEKPVMIFGVYQQRVTDGRNFDYIGEAYPEGFLGGQSNLLFDAEDIAEVLFTGYQTPEYEESDDPRSSAFCAGNRRGV